MDGGARIQGRTGRTTFLSLTRSILFSCAICDPINKYLCLIVVHFQKANYDCIFL